MARVIEIVKAHLETNGFDGLVQTDAECGCLCDDLAPCGGEFGQCEPAYRGADLSGESGDWAMYTSKEDARNSCAEALQRHNAESNGGVSTPTRTPGYRAGTTGVKNGMAIN